MELQLILPGNKSYPKQKQTSFEDLLDFCNILNLHLEPPLKSKYASIYHASNVLQTRIIDTNPYSKNLFENLDPFQQKEFNSLKNHDACKLERQLDRAEFYNLKICGFVHAMAPSIFVKGRLGLNFKKQQDVRQELHQCPDWLEQKALRDQLDWLKKERKSISTCYGGQEFLHYRFWFFDLDYPEFITHYELVDKLEEMGLGPYVSAIVQTSPTKYHAYIKSEMICSENQVKNWPTALSADELEHTVNPEYLSDLANRYRRLNGSEWFQVAKRGLPHIGRLSDIPVPIPEEATLINGYYYGDRKVHDDFLQSWHKFAKVLNADNRTYDGTRVAQLPGYSNPKNSFQAHVVYHNRTAPVLTTKKAREILEGEVSKFYVSYPTANNLLDAALLEDQERNITDFIRCNIDKTGIDTVTNASAPRFTSDILTLVAKAKEYEALKLKEKRQEKDRVFSQKYREKCKAEKQMTKQRAKRVRKIDLMPTDPMDYARAHGLLHDIIWDRDIRGHSNRMLLLLTRFVKCHIRLDDPAQQQYYFDRIIYPYFATKESKDLCDPNWEENFFKRFVSLCRLAKKNLEKFLSQLEYKDPDDVTNINNLKVLFERELAKKLGSHSKVFEEVGHKKLRKIIYDAVEKTGRINEWDIGKIEIKFYIPKQVMSDSIGGRYRDLLRVYEDLNIYRVDYKYIRPFIDEFQVYNKGLCKKHSIYLNCDRKLLTTNEQTLVKDRLKKDEHHVECLSIMQKIMEKKAKKGIRDDIQTG